MARFLPRSTRWRVALFAALASALVLGLGSYWFVRSLRLGLESSANQLASEKASTIAALLDAGIKPVDVAKQLENGGYRISPGKAEDEGCPAERTAAGTRVGLAAVVYGPDCVVGVSFQPQADVVANAGTKE